MDAEIEAEALRALKNAAYRAALHGEGLPTPRPEPDIVEAKVVNLTEKKVMKLSELVKPPGDEGMMPETMLSPADIGCCSGERK